MPRNTPQALVELESRLHCNRIDKQILRHEWDVADALQVFQDWLGELAGPPQDISPLDDTELLREMLPPAPLPVPAAVLALLPALHPIRTTLGRRLKLIPGFS